MTDIEYLMGAVVIRCPECDHGIDPHGTDPGGICGVGDENGKACECLMSPNGIASHLFHKTLDLGLWLIAEERHRGELAAAYWRDDVLPATRTELRKAEAELDGRRAVAAVRRDQVVELTAERDAALAVVEEVRRYTEKLLAAGSLLAPQGGVGLTLDRIVDGGAS